MDSVRSISWFQGHFLTLWTFCLFFHLFQVSSNSVMLSLPLVDLDMLCSLKISNCQFSRLFSDWFSALESRLFQRPERLSLCKGLSSKEKGASLCFLFWNTVLASLQLHHAILRQNRNQPMKANLRKLQNWEANSVSHFSSMNFRRPWNIHTKNAFKSERQLIVTKLRYDEHIWVLRAFHVTYFTVKLNQS